FGKGTVQNVAPLDRRGELGQLKLTIAQFFRVNGEGTQHRGVVPDILFPTAQDSHEQGERGLDNALPWASVDAAPHQTWHKDQTRLEQARRLHAQRARADQRFKLLMEELNVLRDGQKQHSVTLQQDKRRREWEARQTNKDEREALYKKAFGNGTDDEDTDQADILLEEAARVLVDLIDLRAVLVDASHNGMASAVGDNDTRR
ncbi:MAG: carboxy terminal-processing peptidase, partial [Gammaproteobacteria bacterium]|nr:carboxy terminal-processing peptidase [Gammaproteobacteria bacterium]